MGLRLTNVSDEALGVLATLNEGAGVDLGKTRITPRGIKRLKQVRPDLRINATTDDFTLGPLSRQFRPQFTALSQPADWRPVALRIRALGAGVTDAGVGALRGMTNVEELDLTDARVTDGAVNDLASLSGLKTLAIGGTKISAVGEDRLRQTLPGCSVLRTAPGD